MGVALEAVRRIGGAFGAAIVTARRYYLEGLAAFRCGLWGTRVGWRRSGHYTWQLGPRQHGSARDGAANFDKNFRVCRGALATSSQQSVRCPR